LRNLKKLQACVPLSGAGILAAVSFFLGALAVHILESSLDWELKSALAAAAAAIVILASAALKGAPQRQKDFHDIDLTHERLTHAEKLSLMGRIVAGVTHELNNPLTAVVGYSELIALEKGSVKPETAEDLEKIRKEALRCRTIVQGLTAFSRQRSSEKTLLSLEALLNEAVALSAYALRKSGLAVRLEMAPDLACVRGDPQQLQQVLLSLVVNAEEAMLGSGRRGFISVAAKTSGSSVRMVVDDQGPGVPRKLRKRIFEPFFTTKPVGQGTGLGLSLSHGIVQEHGGRLWVEDAPRGGARFVIELPAASAATISPPRASAVAEGGKRILIVDDEENVRSLVMRLLSRLGYSAETAIDGSEARKKLAHGDYDAVISDLAMPGTGGRSLYEWMRRERPELERAWVFLTGSVGEESRRFIQESGRPLLLKPFDVESLESVLRTVLCR
jgi:signal transduction histidine kinase